MRMIFFLFFFSERRMRMICSKVKTKEWANLVQEHIILKKKLPKLDSNV